MSLLLNVMNIAVIGSGVTAFAAASYLSKKGFSVDCIAPRIEPMKKEIDKVYCSENSNKFLSSPKLNRADFIYSKNISDKVFPKECKDFTGIEIVDSIGLARYWGANLAKYALNESINKLNLCNEDRNFLENLIPTLNVNEFYQELNNNKYVQNLKKSSFSSNKNYNQTSLEIFDATLAIWKNKCNLDSLPDERKNEAIFGSNFLMPNSYQSINGRVVDIMNIFDKNKSLVIKVKFKNTFILKSYDYIFVACGAIGSYRLISNICKDTSSLGISHKIKHHPMISRLAFVPNLECPKKYISMSNFDIAMTVNKCNIYLNFYPLKGLFNSYTRNSLKSKYIFKIIKKIYILLNIKSDSPLSISWWIDRLYISSLYFDSDLSSSYITSSKDNLITINGGFRADFQKLILRNTMPMIKSKLKNKKIFLIPFISKIHKPGSDLHYSSTLINYTNKESNLSINKKTDSRIFTIDSSSSEYLPTANPTYYFIARAIKLASDFSTSKR